MCMTVMQKSLTQFVLNYTFIYFLFVQTQLTITFAPMPHISLVEMFINILTCVKKPHIRVVYKVHCLFLAEQEKQRNVVNNIFSLKIKDSFKSG